MSVRRAGLGVRSASRPRMTRSSIPVRFATANMSAHAISDGAGRPRGASRSEGRVAAPRSVSTVPQSRIPRSILASWSTTLLVRPLHTSSFRLGRPSSTVRGKRARCWVMMTIS